MTHEEKTKEITAVKEVWICDPNYHKFSELLLWISPRIIDALRSYIKHSKECFIRFQTLRSWLKKLGCASFFEPTSQCLDIWCNTHPRVWYITKRINVHSSDIDHCWQVHRNFIQPAKWSWKWIRRRSNPYLGRFAWQRIMLERRF